MTLRGKVDRIEKAIISSGGKCELSYDELWRPFEGWTGKEIDQYLIDGSKPEGKGLASFSALINQKIDEKFLYFKGLTKQQICECMVHYALTGIWLERANFDEKPAPSAH